MNKRYTIQFFHSLLVQQGLFQIFSFLILKYIDFEYSFKFVYLLKFRFKCDKKIFNLIIEANLAQSISVNFSINF